MSEITYLSFSDWLTSLSITFSRSVHAVTKGKIFFFKKLSRIPLCQCPIVYCFIHSSTDRHWGCFLIMEIVNKAAVNTGVLMFFRISVLGPFGYIPRSGITRSKGRSIFNFWRYRHTAFHSGCISLHSHQQCERVPFLHILSSTWCLLIY